VKQTFVALAAISTAGLWIWFSQKDVPHQEMSFAFRPDQPSEEKSITMPVDGTVCMIQDLNHRNGMVPVKAYPFADIEGTNRLVVIAPDGTLAMSVDIPSTLQPPTNAWVATLTRCDEMQEGDSILLKMIYSVADASWYLSLN
jgi:hypothetical protein